MIFDACYKCLMMQLIYCTFLFTTKYTKKLKGLFYKNLYLWVKKTLCFFVYFVVNENVQYNSYSYKSSKNKVKPSS